MTTDRRINDPKAYGEFCTDLARKFHDGLITDAECLAIMLDRAPLPTSEETREMQWVKVMDREGQLVE
jgi:hypothetical protein